MPAWVSPVITAVMLAGVASVILEYAAAMQFLHNCLAHLYPVLYHMQEELDTPPMLPYTQQLRLGGTAAQAAEEAWHSATSRTNSFFWPLFCGQYQSCVNCAWLTLNDG